MPITTIITIMSTTIIAIMITTVITNHHHRHHDHQHRQDPLLSDAQPTGESRWVVPARSQQQGVSRPGRGARLLAVRWATTPRATRPSPSQPAAHASTIAGR